MHMEFLYFPEDKSEYIPSLLMLSIFVNGAIVVMYLYYKNQKKKIQNHIKNTQNTFNQNKKKQIQNQMRKNNLLILRGYFLFIALIIRFVPSMINSFGAAIFIRINGSPAVPYEKPRLSPTFAS